jgi:predicted esterase
MSDKRVSMREAISTYVRSGQTLALEGTPVFLGCSDRDPHIPAERVEESAEVFRRLGGTVTARLYPGMGHTVNADEIGFVRGIIDSVTGGGTSPDSTSETAR